MPASKSKQTALVVRSGGSRAPKPAVRKRKGLPVHPAMSQLPSLVQYRLGSSEPLRLPDEMSDPTAAKVLRNEYTITSDAAGHAMFGEHYSLSNAKMSWTITAGTAGVASYTAHPQQSAFNAEARVARMVAARISISYIGATQTGAGYLSYEEKILPDDVNNLTADQVHTGSDVQVTAQDGLVVHLDYTQHPRWESPTASSFMIYTFPVAVFIASGLPVSTPVFRVRIERFVEYLPLDGTLSEGEVRHEPHDPGAMSAHGALSGNPTSIRTQAGESTFFSRVRSAANAAYHMAQPLLPYVVDAARSQLSTMSMARYALLAA